MTTTAVTPSDRRTVPALGKPRTPKLPSVGERTLDNGLRVLAVRRPGVPLAELRLRIPFAGPKGRGADTHVARAQLLGDTLLSGTPTRSASQVAADVQALGGQLSASTDADRLGFGASVLSSGLPGLLEILAEVLTGATYPKDEVVGERDRLVSELAIYRSQAGVVAREALLQRMYGDHPYGRDLPEAEAVEAVTAAQLRSLHARRVAPAGSVLVVVGDLTPARAIGLVEQALSGWTTQGEAVEAPPVPQAPQGAAVLLDRPGAVQTTLRLGGPAPSRTAPDYAAFTLANLVFGGYFSSRWVANIREDKGYTYSPHSSVEHPPAGSRVVVSADVATDVTAPAVLETLYELGRIATVPVGQDELDQARRYAIGSLALSTASQAGLASTLSLLAGAGLGVEWLRDHPRNLGTVTVEQVLAAGAQWLAPRRLTGVLVGDAATVAGPLSGVLDIEPA
ncbi:MAG: peptidase domain protein [Frankiales bacterium]|jgi:zinc protease|nr:peptidase domain protein [Frankiales bacterium]